MSASMLVKRITRMLERGEGERYRFSVVSLGAIARTIDRAVVSDQAIESVGALLKLVFVLRTKHASPSAARAIVEQLRRSPGAMSIIDLHWSSGRSLRGAANGGALPRLAPHVDAIGRGVKLARLHPVHDSKRQHLERKR
jgi:hypothetical protein